MHTAEAARGRGIGRAIIEHLIGVARQRGYRALSLETGSGPAFSPARRRYASAGSQALQALRGLPGDPEQARS